jgi:hypothetical protein
MKKACPLIVALILVAGCGAATSDDLSTSTSAAAGTTTSVVTTTSPTTTSTPATTSTTVVDSPDIVLDAALSGPFAPWHSVAVASADLQMSGFVTPGSEVVLMVSSPPVEGGIVFEGDATVENDYFYGDVSLVPGRNIVTAIATSPAGTTSAVALDARYEPDATVEFGFLTAVSAGEIVADYAQWLSGDEANQAAFEDGVIASVEEGVPNDYYIRNANPQLRTLPLADDVAVWLISPVEGVTSVEVAIEEWLGLFNGGAAWDYETDEIPNWDEPYFGYYGAAMVQTPYWFVILDGEVIAIEQQYVP